MILSGARLTGLASMVAAAAGGDSPMALAEFNDKGARTGWANARFRIEGLVRGISSDRRLVALQDASGALLLECPDIPANASIGEGLAVSGRDCMVAPGHFAVRIVRGALMVEVDGYHPMVSRSGSVLLAEGLRPFRLDWFNGGNRAGLELEYEGPGLSRQPVPAASFMHAGDSGGFAPGLRYRTFVNDSWTGIDDMSKSEPTGSGIAPGVGLEILPRTDRAGLSFEGYLRIPEAGVYSFHLGSEDGSRLVVGEGEVSCEVLPGYPASPEPGEWTGTMPPGKTAWVKGGGVVTFSSRMEDRVEMDVADEDSSYHVTILDAGMLRPFELLYRQVRFEGIGRAEGVTVVGTGNLATGGDATEPADLLTQAIQVRRLQPEEARKPCRVRLRGVVTMAGMGKKMVIQDASGGVFVWYEAPVSGREPRPGEVWEIEGTTGPGAFSPMIEHATVRYWGTSPVLRATRPSWDQLVNGSMDAELVEIEGVVVSASTSSMELQTREGMISIRDDISYPVPARWLSDPELAALPGSVVRIKGVFKAEWDSSGRVRAGFCSLGNALMTVEEPVPGDPFALPAMPVSDLRLFTSHAGPFKRVKVAGQVLQSRPPLLFLSDGQTGFRVVSRDAATVAAGDMVEVAGFPRLGGVSPTLVQAGVRQTASAPLPEPLDLPADSLPDSRFDSRRVRIEATLLNHHSREGERLLEMETGSRRFIARMVTPGPDTGPIRPGSVLQLVGTYAAGSSGSPPTAMEGFELLMNGPADMVVLRPGPWWTPGHTIATIGLLSGGILIAGGWVLLLRRAVGLRTKELAREIEERQRMERHREMEQERSRVAHDLHDELGAALTEVGMLAGLVKSTAVPEHKKGGYLDRLSEVSHDTVTALDEIVWAVNPRYDSVGGLAGYFLLFAQRFLELPGIRCRPRISESMTAHPLGSHQRHGLFLAFKEALNNIVRHSGASEVLLSIDVEEGNLRIRVSDDGCGFDPLSGHPLGSEGLANMAERMAKLGGKCDISAEPGEGTMVEFTLPLGRSKE
jgi:signal transduction histidine kinase